MIRNYSSLERTFIRECLCLGCAPRGKNIATQFHLICACIPSGTLCVHACPSTTPTYHACLPELLWEAGMQKYKPVKMYDFLHP